MLLVKKIQAVIETMFWLMVVIVMICIFLPLAGMLTLAGMGFKLIHVNFVSDIAGRFMNMLIAFVQFVTGRIRKRTREIEALRAKAK